MLLFAAAAAAQVPAGQVPEQLRSRWIDLAPSDWLRGKNGRQYNFSYTLGPDPTERNAGFFGQRLRRELAAQNALTPEVIEHLDAYRRRRRLFIGERLLFGATVITYGAFVLEDNKYFEPKEVAVLGVLAFSLISNVFVTRNANMHMQRAVKAYQGNAFPQRPTGQLLRHLRPAFGGIGPVRGGVGAVVGWHL